MHGIHISDINSDAYITKMLNIKILKKEQSTYIVEVYSRNKLITTRKITTNNYLDVFEKLEVLLKCEPQCAEALKPHA